MNGIGRGEDKNKKEKNSILTKETVGMTMLLFSIIVFFIAVTGPIIFGDIGVAITAFFIGLSGFFIFPLLLLLIIESVSLIAGKKLIPSRFIFRTFLLIFAVFTIVHTATAERFFGSGYGAYLGGCWSAASKGIGGGTGGGVLFGLLGYPVRLILSAPGAYVLASLFVAFALFYFLMLTPLAGLIKPRERKPREKKAVTDINSRRVTFDDLPAREHAAMPASGSYGGQAVRDDYGYGMQKPSYQPAQSYQTPTQQPVNYGYRSAPATPQNNYAGSADPRGIFPQSASRDYRANAAQPSSESVDPKQHSRDILFGGSPAESYRNNLIFDHKSAFNNRSARSSGQPSEQNGAPRSYSAPASESYRQLPQQSGYVGNYSADAETPKPSMPKRVTPVEPYYPAREESVSYPTPSYRAPEPTEPESGETHDYYSNDVPTEFSSAPNVNDYEAPDFSAPQTSDSAPSHGGEFIRDPADRASLSPREEEKSDRGIGNDREGFDDSLSGSTFGFGRNDYSSRASMREEGRQDEEGRENFNRREELGRREDFGSREELSRRENFDRREEPSRGEELSGRAELGRGGDFDRSEEPDQGEEFDRGEELGRGDRDRSAANLFDDDYDDEGDYREQTPPESPRSVRGLSSRSRGGARENLSHSDESAAAPSEREGMPAAQPTPEPPKAPVPQKHVYKEYHRPNLALLKQYDDHSSVPQEEIVRNSDIIIDTLRNFRVEVQVVNVTCGSAVTRYDIEIPKNIPVGTVIKRDAEIAMHLHARNGVNMYVNNETGSISIEVPNAKRATVGLKSILYAEEYANAKPGSLMFAIGKDIEGRNVCGNIVKMKHLLVAGSTGSGKSVCLNAMLISLICKYSPEEMRLILIDPKKVEFAVFSGLPHLMINEIISDPQKAVSALNWAVKEMERRYTLFEQKTLSGKNVHNLDEYNEALTEEEEKLPKIVIIVDELADLMTVAKKDIEERIQRLAQKARAAGIHLVIATQRPSVDVITGVIKGNLPTRFAFRTIQEVDSRTILDESGAEKLLGLGDMLYRTEGMFSCLRVQGAFLSSEEVQAIVDDIKKYNESYFDDSVSEYINKTSATSEGAISGGDVGEGDGNVPETYIKALAIAVKLGSASISLVQRKCSVGYNHAGKIIEWMESMGYISEFDGKAKARTTLLTKEEFEAKYGSLD